MTNKAITKFILQAAKILRAEYQNQLLFTQPEKLYIIRNSSLAISARYHLLDMMKRMGVFIHRQQGYSAAKQFTGAADVWMK